NGLSMASLRRTLARGHGRAARWRGRLGQADSHRNRPGSREAPAARSEGDRMNRLLLVPLLFALGCGSSKGSVQAKTGGINRKVVDKDELAALLNDNPTALAGRAKDGDSGVAAKDKPPAKEEENVGKIVEKAKMALEAKDYAAAAKLAADAIALDPKGYP